MTTRPSCTGIVESEKSRAAGSGDLFGGPRLFVVDWGRTTGGSADHRFCGPRLFGPVMERSNPRARIGGHSHAVDPAERDRRSNRPSADGFLSAQAGVFVVT